MSDLEQGARRAAPLEAPPWHPPRPRLWAAVNVVVGPLWWALAAWASRRASSPLPSPRLLLPLAVVVGLLAAAALVAVVLRRWRWAVCLAAIGALPVTVVGLALLAAFGLGVVVLVPTASWWAVVVSSARRLAWGERAVGGPSPEQRARRVRGWSSLLVVVCALLAAGAAVLVARGAVPGVGTGFGTVTLVLAASVTLTIVGAVLLLGLSLASRWDAVATTSTLLLVAILVSGGLGAIVGLTFVLLLIVPVAMASSHAQLLRPRRVAERQAVTA